MAELELCPKKLLITGLERIYVVIPSCYTRSRRHPLKLMERKIKESENVFH